MSSWFGRFKEFVGMPAPEEDYEDFDYDEISGEDYAEAYRADSQGASELNEEPNSPSQEGLKAKLGSSLSNVVGMPGTGRLWGSMPEVFVLAPQVFEEMPQVIQALRERKSVVLNLSMMDPAQAQRAVDFVAGATYTIDGHQERVGENIFLFTPNCVQVRTKSDVVNEAPQVPTPRVAMTSWQTDESLHRIAQ